MISLDPTPIIESQLRLVEHNKSQKQRVLDALLRGEVIGPEWGHRNRITAYSQRISELRREKHDIKDRTLPGGFSKEYYI